MPQITGEPAGRIAPVEELVNALEFEAMAQRTLDSLKYALVASGGRKPLDRVTLRPRVMVNTTKLDLTLDLFGLQMFAPILIGPVGQQKRFHPEGELAMAKGAAAAKAVMVISDRSSQPLDQIARLCTEGFWYQIYAEPDMAAATGRAKAAVAAGAKAVCLTLSGSGLDWSGVERVRQELKAPFVLKGVMSVEEAQACVQKGVQGIVVSNYVDGPSAGLASPIEVLPGIADAVAGKIPVLLDGGLVRGADMLKALALGARAVLIARPAVWGLAGYGADGVQRITELLQTELARDMAMTGKPNLKVIDRSTVQVHRW
jgi:isopentenyl diphosphate isomerase/L-lactate dehydrogenase-like FMN-dependent dehydrogenase